MGRVSSMEKKVYVGASSAVFATTEGTRRKLGVGRVRRKVSHEGWGSV